MLDFRVQGADRGHNNPPCSRSNRTGAQHLQMSITAPVCGATGGGGQRATGVSPFSAPNTQQRQVERRFWTSLSRPAECREHALLSQTELFWKLWHSWRKTKCCQTAAGKQKSGESQDEAIISKSQTHDELGKLKPRLAGELVIKKTKENHCNAFSLRCARICQSNVAYV